MWSVTKGNGQGLCVSNAVADTCLCTTAEDNAIHPDKLRNAEICFYRKFRDDTLMIVDADKLKSKVMPFWWALKTDTSRIYEICMESISRSMVDFLQISIELKRSKLIVRYSVQ